MTTDDTKPAILAHLPEGWIGRISTIAADLDISPAILVARAVQTFLDAAECRLPAAQTTSEGNP